MPLRKHQHNSSPYPASRGIGLFFISLLFMALQYSCESPPPPPAPNGGLFLPDGFEAVVVVDSLEGKARQLAVRDNGDLFVKLRYSNEEGGSVVLRDTNQDGRADIIRRFGVYEHKGKYGYQTAIHIRDSFLYSSTELAVYRHRLEKDQMVPVDPPEIIVLDDHEHGDHEHNGKPIAFDEEGHIYVPYGAPSNACQDPKRTPGMPGMDPCPQLEYHGGIWQYDANDLCQTQLNGKKYASGIRSVVAMNWNKQSDELYLVMHGRDDLLRLFPQQFSPWQSALLPSEEFLKVTEGSNFGWPYCFYDQMQGKKVLAPEYGGDGKTIGRCADYDDPVMGFPGHWAPNDLLFYEGDQFPDRYQGGAFIAFHGSTNRAPYPQSGYFISFIPFNDGEVSQEWEVFADGFAQVDPIVSVKDAKYRPMGLAVAPDGSLYIAETEKGKIWHVTYTGKKEEFGAPQLASMEARKQLSHIRTPDKITDNLQEEITDKGQALYHLYCGICHQKNGQGASGRFPPLADTDYVTGDPNRLIGIILNGMEGGIEVNGEAYSGVMPQHSFLSNEEVAEILTYVRSNFGNTADAISAAQVEKVRSEAVVK